MTIHRLHRRRRPAADYGGSLAKAGRWNTTGHGVLYCASSVSLCCLESLVHLDRTEIPSDYVWSTAQLDDVPGILEYHGDLWHIGNTRLAGDSWLQSRDALAVRVPSVVIPSEHNVLLNSALDEFDHLEWSAPEPFTFDPRLLDPDVSYLFV